MLEPLKENEIPPELLHPSSEPRISLPENVNSPAIIDTKVEYKHAPSGHGVERGIRGNVVGHSAHGTSSMSDKNKPVLQNPQATKDNVGGTELGRLEEVWKDLLYSNTAGSVVIYLHSYGYLVSLIMTVYAWTSFIQFGRIETILAKMAFQIIGFFFSLWAVIGCYVNNLEYFRFFYLWQFFQMIFVLVTLCILLFKMTREKFFDIYINEPFYNIKLVDQPNVEEFRMLDMSAEPAFELSLLYFRAVYMLAMTLICNVYTLHAIDWKIRFKTKHDVAAPKSKCGRIFGVFRYTYMCCFVPIDRAIKIIRRSSI